jgi:hypothetical protein
MSVVNGDAQLQVTLMHIDYARKQTEPGEPGEPSRDSSMLCNPQQDFPLYRNIYSDHKSRTLYNNWLRRGAGCQYGPTKRRSDSPF